MSPHTSARIEFYNYSVMGKGGISWRHHINRIRPHIILMISDGRSQLIQGLRHSIKELISESSIGKKPLVIFRSLETPTIVKYRCPARLCVRSDR